MLRRGLRLDETVGFEVYSGHHLNPNPKSDMDENVLQGKRVLVVDDEADLREIVASELEFMGGIVTQAENISEAKDILNSEKIDLIVSDIRMPGGTGVDLLDYIKSRDVNEPPIMLITGFADITVQEAFDRGAEALMNKPFKLDDLILVAARLTGPLEKRFQVDDFPANKELSLSSEDIQDFALGRGGCSFRFNTKGKRFDISEVLDFKLDLDDRKISGTGMIRWKKNPEVHDGSLTIGLEFLNLDSESLAFELANFQSKKTKALIPTL